MVNLNRLARKDGYYWCCKQCEYRIHFGLYHGDDREAHQIMLKHWQENHKDALNAIVEEIRRSAS